MHSGRSQCATGGSLLGLSRCLSNRSRCLDDKLPPHVQVVWSVVQDYDNYWVAIRSPVIDIIQHSDVITFPTTTTTTTTARPKVKHPVYAGCEVNKTCFGLYSECEDTFECDILATWSVGDEVTFLELYRNTLGDNDQDIYAAMALSLDRMMGDDFVIACTR